MTLQEVFNTVVMQAEPLAIPLDSKRAYETLRVALVRKFSNYRAQCQRVGIESYDARYVSCSYVDSIGAFELRWLEESKRVRKDYQAFKL